MIALVLNLSTQEMLKLLLRDKLTHLMVATSSMDVEVRVETADSLHLVGEQEQEHLEEGDLDQAPGQETLTLLQMLEVLEDSLVVSLDSELAVSRLALDMVHLEMDLEP